MNSLPTRLDADPGPRDGEVHAFFGLSYANYLVLPRTLVQSMPLWWPRGWSPEQASRLFNGSDDEKLMGAFNCPTCKAMRHINEDEGGDPRKDRCWVCGTLVPYTADEEVLWRAEGLLPDKADPKNEERS